MFPASPPASELYQISVPITDLSLGLVHVETWRCLRCCSSQMATDDSCRADGQNKVIWSRLGYRPEWYQTRQQRRSVSWSIDEYLAAGLQACPIGQSVQETDQQNEVVRGEDRSFDQSVLES